MALTRRVAVPMASNRSQDGARRPSKRSRPSSRRSKEVKSQAAEKRNVDESLAASVQVPEKTSNATSTAVVGAQATNRIQGSAVADTDDEGDSSKVGFKCISFAARLTQWYRARHRCPAYWRARLPLCNHHRCFFGSQTNC